METNETQAPIRIFLLEVAAEFRRANPGMRTSAVLEPADTGASFERDMVRAKFRKQKSTDLNAVGIIVFAGYDATPPVDLSPTAVAVAINERVDAIHEVTRHGVVARVEYKEVHLDEVLRDLSAA